MDEAGTKQTHVDIRRLAAEEAAVIFHNLYVEHHRRVGEPTPSCPPDLADKIEEVLLLGEKRGVSACLEYLGAYVQALRTRLTHGVANHVEGAVGNLRAWFHRSPNFITAAEQEARRNGDDVTVNRAAKQLAQERAMAEARPLQVVSKDEAAAIPLEPADDDHGPFPPEAVAADMAHDEALQRDLEKPRETSFPTEEKDGVKVVDKRRFIGMAEKQKE